MTWQGANLRFLGENRAGSWSQRSLPISEAPECEVMQGWEAEVTVAGQLAVKTDRRHLLNHGQLLGISNFLTHDTMLSSEKLTFENHAIWLTTTIKVSLWCKFIIACWVPFMEIFSWMCSTGPGLHPLPRMLEQQATDCSLGPAAEK